MESRHKNNAPSYIIAVGASAGGLNALSELMSQVKPDIDAAFLIVMHLSRKSISDYLAHRLQQFTKVPCSIAEDDQPVLAGRAYIAPPNYHLLIKDGKLLLGHGPQENRWRPSIDVLFRSVAAAHNGSSIGIILTGLLDDGTAGMLAIKRCGGTCIVQDPNEAEYPDMPLSVLNNMEVDHCVSLAEMGTVIQRITSQKRMADVPIPEDIRIETEIAARVAVGIDNVAELGEHTIYSCPDCGGGLWKLSDNNFERYRCHIGHSYSERDLNVRQAEALEATLWVALRMMEERRNLLKKLNADAKRKGFTKIATEHLERMEELQSHIDQMRQFMVATQNVDNT